MIEGVNEAGEYIWVTNGLLILLIFVTAVLAMFAFASMIQGYFLTRNRWLETLLFAISAAILFRPEFFSGLTGMPVVELMYVVGAGIFGLVYFLQRQRMVPAAEAA